MGNHVAIAQQHRSVREQHVLLSLDLLRGDDESARENSATEGKLGIPGNRSQQLVYAEE